MPLTPAKCKCCGAKVDIDPATKTGTCKFCENSYIWDESINNYVTYVTNHNSFLGANFNVLGPSAEKYVKLAMSSLEAGNNSEALDYAKKALEIQPDSSTAWIVRMMTTQSQNASRKPIAKEIVAYGGNAIRYASDEKKEQVKKIVYRHYLAHAIVMMATAVAEERNALYLQGLIAENADAESKSMAGDLATQAISLKSEVPESYFDSSAGARKQVVRLSNLYLDYWSARGKKISCTSKPSNTQERTLMQLMHSLTDDEKLLVNGYAAPVKVDPEKEKFYIPITVYGSYECPKVWMLRRYRDQHLKTTWRGRLALRSYYAVSPTLVKYFGRTQWFWRFCKNRLNKLVVRLQAQGVESTRYRDIE